MMKRILSLVLCLVMAAGLVACAAPAAEAPPAAKAEAAAPAAPAEEAAESPYVEDAEFRYYYTTDTSTMNYLNTITTADFAMAANTVDSLVEYDRYGVVQPCLAESWEVSEDGLVWTIKLKEGIMWYDCEGEEYAPTTADDFVFGLEWILNPENESNNVDVVSSVIKNAREFYEGSVTDFAEVGVKALDEYTLQYTLKATCPYFESMLSYIAFLPANRAFAAEQGEYYGTSNDTILYNGAYICTSWEPQSETVLERNENYWDVENVHIKTIYGKYNAEAEALAPEAYLRGEIDEAQIPVEILNSWMEDPEKKDIVRPNRSTFDAMWWFMDFDPNFDAPYDSAAWKAAVNNRAFRLSIAYGIDRVKAMTCYDPYNPQGYLMNTVTPPNFVSTNGVDYTMTGELKTVSETEWFQPETALSYKEQAMAELAAQGVSFPIVFPYYYRLDQANQDLVAQVVEQQLEGLLGTDYIDIQTIAHSGNSYSSEVRKPGKYGMMEEGWGPDFADPVTYSEPWCLTGTYNYRAKSTDESYLTGYVYTQEDFDNGVISDASYVGQPQQIYDKLLQEASAEKVDLAKRYELLAKAEAWLINEGIVIPFRVFSKGYVASKLTVFDGCYSSFGLSSHRYKGKHVLKEAMSVEQYQQQFAQWETERAAALAAAN